MTEEWKASFPVRKDSIEELVGHRDHALQLAEQALRTLVEAEETCETTYMSFRMFRGNGNLHIKFLRPDLVDRINDILARHYGVVLPDDRKAA